MAVRSYFAGGTDAIPEEDSENQGDQERATSDDAYASEGKFHRPLRERLHPCEDV